ncbi:MAG: hypothetical protein HYR60_08555, partial [Acidobacteria bacterium]|nr:hypothetical protein [Acidobacteriota bacterium]
MPRLLCTLILALAWPLSAQSKAPVPVADYGKWESLDFTTQISSDGKWMAYRILRSNGNHELRAAPLSSGRPHTAAFGESAAFSADSQWLAYLIGIHEDQEEKLKKAKKPIHKKLGLLRLATSQLTTVENIEAFAFSKSGAFLAMKHYAPERAAAPAEASDPPPDPPAAGLTIRNLASASDASFGSVSSYAWSDAAPVAAMTISNEGKAGNAIQAYDAASGSLRTLDSAAATYHGLTWRPDSSDLAVLRARPDEKRENDNCVLLIFRGAEKVAYDPRADAQFPADTRIVKSRAPSFSEDGARLTVGLAPWDKKEPALKDKPEGDPSNVEVWHSQDPHVMPEQKLRAVRDRDRQTTAVFHIASRHLVQVTANPDEQVQPARFAPRIFTADPHPYEREGMFGREYADMYQVDPASGGRVKLLEKAEYIGRRRAGLGPSPTGRYLIHIQKDILFLRDLSTGKETSLTRGLEAAFIDAEFDHPVAQKPPYG